jgi:hypothetical protein
MKEPQNYTALHRHLLEVVAREVGFADPVAIDLDAFRGPLLKAARRGAILPIDGVLVRDWTPGNRHYSSGMQLGMRLYEIEGIRFAHVAFDIDSNLSMYYHHFTAVDRKDYRQLYRIALKCRRDAEPPSTRPVLPPEQVELLWKNTIGYLDRKNLRTIKAYGGRAKRGVLLTGEPGNGKTMACRWIWEECRRRNWDWRLVSPDSYRAARSSCNPVAAVRQLFTVERRGVVFFDDMDIALRDRETVHETDDQAVFLSALDGIAITEGVVFVFTTNCSLDLIDQAFKRPGRLDLVLHFGPPDGALRRELINSWHPDIRDGIDINAAVADTAGYSFAEVEELKNLLIMRFLDVQEWDWKWSMHQFAINRDELAAKHRRQVGFYSVGTEEDGHRNGEVPF